MATKRVVTKGKNRLLAYLVTGKREPCAFCQRDTDDEAVYGKLYAIGDIQVHYFCALLSCCLVQKGKDSEGLFGFLYPDIVAEVERSKKHKCSFCNTGGASLGCSVAQCRKQFHLPCGRQRNAVSLFFGNYKSFCQQHAPRQKIPEHIMAPARIRMKKAKSALKAPQRDNSDADASQVCVICYEPVEAYPCARSFWPPCCARDAWFHSNCLQRMALSAGVHYLKCPLCNDKEQFYSAVVGQGYYVPDRDAAWELDRGAFAEIYERARLCSARTCACPNGRSHDADDGPWDIQLCILCGTQGVHAGCADGAGGRVCAGAGAGGRWVCAVCVTCAPEDITALANKIDEVIQEEQRQSRQNTRRAVVMPSRMSLRRTKARTINYAPSTSQINSTPAIDTKQTDTKSDTASARLDLNLKTPGRPSEPQQHNTKSTRHTEQQSSVLKTIENTLFSPTKLVEKKMKGLGVKNISSEKMVTKIKEKLKKPRPLCVKKKIVNTVLDQLLLDLLSDTQKSEILRSPMKIFNDTEKVPEDNTNKEVERPITSIDLRKTGDDKEIKEVTPTKDGVGTVNEKEDDADVKADDDSSNSTFQLPSEFVADHHSDDSLSLFETPKKLTTVDIQKDSSLEISENNEVVNINVTKIEENSASNEFIKNLKLKIPVKTDKCAFKFNPLDKETLQEDKVDIDVESFKNFYLNEVDRDFQCSFNHKHKKDCKKTKLRTAIDFAVDATKIKEQRKKKLKRKIEPTEGVVQKKSKKDKEIVVSCNKDTTNNIKVCLNDSDNDTESIDLTLEKRKSRKSKKSPKISANKNSDNTNETINLTVETSKPKKRLKKLKKKKHKDNIQVKIRFREKQVRLEINTNTQSQVKTKKMKTNKRRKLINEKKLKQWILKYTDNSSPSNVLVKPEHDVTPKKRNYVKLEKSPDALVQTSIHSFFKKVPTTG